MQKRLLNDYIQNIHRKYPAEHHSREISYSLFCMLRPFLVVHPTTQDRETCQCKTRENLSIIANKLKQHNTLHTSNVEVLADGILCEPSNKACEYDECAFCKRIVPEVSWFLQDEMVTYTQWRTVAQPLPNDKETSMNITEKVDITESKQDILEKFQNSFSKFKRHRYNTFHQFCVCREIRKKMHAVQSASVHFGGSHQQITLHTGVLCVGDLDEPFAPCRLP